MCRYIGHAHKACFLSNEHNGYQAAAEKSSRTSQDQTGYCSIINIAKQTASSFHLSRATCISEYHNMTGITAV